MKKRMLFVVLAMLFACLMTINISAADVIDSGNCGDNLTWNFYDDGELGIEGTGATVSGTITSFLSKTEPITVQLMSGETEVASTTVTGNTAEYKFDAVAAGTYTLRVSKLDHVTREYAVVVGGEDITQNVKIHIIGDITGDGEITVVDAARANSHAKKVTFLAGYELICADINGDGKISIYDAGRINSHAKKVTFIVDIPETEPEDPEPEIDTRDLYENDGNPTYDRVIIIGVDGGGAFFKDTHTPNIDAIFAKGAVTYTMQTSTPSISAQSWGALIHGVKPEFHRLTNDIVSSTPYDTESVYPSFFRVVREAYPDAVLASFCTWNPINVGIIENGLNVTKDTAGNDAALTEKILNYLDSNDPTVLFVQFDNVDGAGHGSGYGSDKHLQQITTTDEYIGRIYKKLDEKGLLRNTLIIVTADHGGTPAGGHGGSTPAEMNIMFAVAGKTVVNGGEVESKDENGNADNAQIRDTAAVVLHAFGLTQPESWTGTVPGDTFVGVDAVTRPESKIIYDHEHRTHESTPTPAADSGNYITDVLGADRVKAYLTFDNTIADAMGNSTSMKENGKIYYVDGYYGAGAQLSETYVELEEMYLDKDSFTVSLWFKTGGVNGDPSLISNKNWNNGYNPGFVLSLRENDVKFNLGDGSSRTDSEWQLPVDYVDGWVHVVFSVDRAANKIYLCYDFGKLVVKEIGSALADASFDGISGLVIGQDGTKNYGHSLSAVIDDVIIIDGAVTADDVAALADYYGIKS